MERLVNHADISKGMLGRYLPADLEFTKADKSGPNGGNCPEFAWTDDDRIVVRDSHQPNGPVQVYTPAQIAAMADGFQQGGNLHERFVVS